jgi:hypothetical protein
VHAVKKYLIRTLYPGDFRKFWHISDQLKKKARWPDEILPAARLLFFELTKTAIFVKFHIIYVRAVMTVGVESMSSIHTYDSGWINQVSGQLKFR